MQTHGGATAEKAILANEREFAVRVAIDWNMDGFYDHGMSDVSDMVRSVTTDASLRGTLPEDILSIQGSSAAELTVTLHGEYLNLPLYKVLSPYQPDSPFWGKDLVGPEITYELGVVTGVGVTWYAQFVGLIRTVEPDRATGYVTITALDRVELLRRPVTFPGFAMFEPQRNVLSRVEGQLLDSQWVIDHCLKTSDVSATAWRPTSREENGLEDNDPTGPQLWVSGVGGWTPNIGWCDNYPAQEFPYTEVTGVPMYEQFGEAHPDMVDGVRPKNMTAMGSDPNSSNLYWCLNRDAINTLGIQTMGFTLITDPDSRNGTLYQTLSERKILDVDLGNNINIDVRIGDSGKVWTVWSNTDPVQSFVSPKVTIPTGGDAVRIQVAWDTFHTSGIRVYVKAGTNTSGVSWSTVAGSPSSFADDDEFKGLVVIDRVVGLNDIYYTSTNYGNLSVTAALDWGGRQATYAGSVDPGLNRLSFLPQRQADDAWEVISSVSGAEFGAAFWDESGQFRFWNRDTLKSKSTQIVRDVYLDHLNGLRITNTLDGVRNIWSMDSQRKVTRFQRTIEAQSYDEFYVDAGTQKLYTIWRDDVVSVDPGKVPRYTAATWNDDVEFGYVAQWLEGGVWQENDSKVSGLDIFLYMNEFGEIVVNIYNGYDEPARLASNIGQPTLRVPGSEIIGYGNQVLTLKDAPSIEKYEGRNIRLSGDWYQEYSNYVGLITDMVLRTARPVPTTDQVTLAGDPRIQLADAIRIHDPDGLGSQFDVQIYGIRRTLDVDSGLTDTYSIELSKPPGGVWDDPVMGLWDSPTFIWG